jgi:ergosteryl-3beta-O-L-aspartate synthase
VSLILGLGNVRYAALFPRDPESFPTDPPRAKLHSPKDNTLHRTKGRLPPLENIIANYGDTTNTSWMDERFEVWRDANTEAVIAFVRVHTHAIIAGNPLCDIKQYTDVIGAFLRWLMNTTHLKPIFVLVSQEVEEVLGTEFSWKSLSCTAERRVDLTHDGHTTSEEVDRKIRHAKSVGVKVVDLGHSVPTTWQEIS